MINGLGVLGWGVGGSGGRSRSARPALEIITPKTVGVRLSGRLQAGASATDLALSLTELLRKLGVIDQFVEFFGPALAGLSVSDRATVANMAPEYGATCAYFPIDDARARLFLLPTAMAVISSNVSNVWRASLNCGTTATARILPSTV